MTARATTKSVEENRERNRSHAGRDVCERCRRPTSACYCASLTSIKTKTRLVLLQHPRERYVAIGTAHMASLCIEGSELHVGIDWSESAPLRRALEDPERPPILLYPGKESKDIVKDPPKGPVTLVVVDGTWSQTKKVVRVNPILQNLPRYAFVPPRPSEYRIRKEPDATSVSTIEALVHTLSALEGAPNEGATSFDAMLAPFRAMIDHQIECEARYRGTQSRHAARRARPKRQRVPRVLSDRLEDVVLVVGEANSWPYAMRADPKYKDELVHWVAYRPASGELLSFIVKPRGEIAPGTSLHTGISEDDLRAGGSLEELHAKWRAFTRDTDVIAAWGHYERNLFMRGGENPNGERGERGLMPNQHLDLRGIARDVARGGEREVSFRTTRAQSAQMRKRGTVGSLAEYRESILATSSSSVAVPGRAGRKLNALVEIVAMFVETASTNVASTPRED